MLFEELQLIEPLLRAVHAEGYTEPSPIQQQAIPHVLQGRDLLGCAQTGTGKTAAFALPILQRLAAHQGPKPSYVRVLVLSPTRELASQIGASFDTYGKHLNLRQVTIFGGVNQNPQIGNLRRNPDIVVATPGRLLDLIGQGFVKLDRLEVLVLDEADRMLDMGFIHDVKRIIAALPVKRQTLLFSATMPPEIQGLASSILNSPVNVAVTPESTTVEKIDQSVFFVEKGEKPALLEHLLQDRSIRRVLVFTRTKHGANKVVKQLARGNIFAEAIHGNKSQSARETALTNFKSGRTRVLVATDIAARGIDVDDITHVINYDLPNEPESYVHRIGRTARAGASGIAFSFCEVEERPYLASIERLIRLHVPRAENHPYASRMPQMPMTNLADRGRGGVSGKPSYRGNGGGNRSGQPRRDNRSGSGNGNRSNSGYSRSSSSGSTSNNGNYQRYGSTSSTASPSNSGNAGNGANNAGGGDRRQSSQSNGGYTGSRNSSYDSNRNNAPSGDRYERQDRQQRPQRDNRERSR